MVGPGGEPLSREEFLRVQQLQRERKQRLRDKRREGGEEEEEAAGGREARGVEAEVSARHLVQHPQPCTPCEPCRLRWTAAAAGQARGGGALGGGLR